MKTKLILISFIFLVATSLCVQEKEEQHELSCNPDWSCTEWSEKCIDSEFTRICTDLNNCNITEGKPDELKQCTVETDIVTLQFYLLTARDLDNGIPGIDSLFFRVAPKDAKGSIVKQDGTIDAALWIREYDENHLPAKGYLIGTWNDTQVYVEDYDYTGASVSLSFGDNYTPDAKDYGILEVTFITPEGARITQVKDNVLLGRQVFY
jgi:hypothetical protein